MLVVFVCCTFLCFVGFVLGIVCCTCLGVFVCSLCCFLVACVLCFVWFCYVDCCAVCSCVSIGVGGLFC